MEATTKKREKTSITVDPDLWRRFEIRRVTDGIKSTVALDQAIKAWLERGISGVPAEVDPSETDRFGNPIVKNKEIPETIPLPGAQKIAGKTDSDQVLLSLPHDHLKWHRILQEILDAGDPVYVNAIVANLVGWSKASGATAANETTGDTQALKDSQSRALADVDRAIERSKAGEKRTERVAKRNTGRSA